MRNLKVLWLLLGFLCCSAIAGPKDDAVQVVERWAKAFTAADVEAIVSLYAPDAVFMGTVSKTIVTTPEDIRKYFQVALLGKRRFVASFVQTSVTAAAETAFVITALDKLVVTTEGNTEEVFGRVTFVVAKRESNWKIISFHRSAMPS
jgi:uncharacterized protein (TIGR02246 family)